MTASAPWFDAWLARTALGGGALLLLGLLSMILIRQPARRQRLGELALLSSLLAALLAALPSWWELSLRAAPPEPRLKSAAPLQPAEPLPQVATEEPLIIGYLLLDEAEIPAEPTAPPSALVAFEPPATPWLSLLGVAYLAIMGLLLARCALGYWGLARLVRRSRPAPVRVRELMASLTPGGTPIPRLAVTDRLHSPVSFGLREPTILLPADFCRPGQDDALRSVLAHELTHLVRRDAWSCLLLAVSQSVYFYVPWFWWLRRQLRLAQEYIADAAAARVFSAVDYAQYLVALSARANPGSLALSRANGVFQSPSDLSRRVEMLLKPQSQVERAVPGAWSWLAAGAFLGVAALTSGVKLHADEPAQKEDIRARAVKNQGEECEACAKAVEGQILLLTAADGEEKEAKARSWVAAPQEKENLERLQKALESLKAAAKRLGDDVPEEVKERLRDVEKQLAEAKKRLVERSVQRRSGVDADKARKLAEDYARRGQAEAERARKLAEDFAAKAMADAEAHRTRAQEAAKAARDRALAAEKAARVHAERAADDTQNVRQQMEALRKDAERAAAEVKRRLDRLNQLDDDNRKLEELEALKALMSKAKDMKAKLRLLEEKAADQEAKARAAADDVRTAERTARSEADRAQREAMKARDEAAKALLEAARRAPTPPAPPMPPGPAAAPSASTSRFAIRSLAGAAPVRLGVAVEPVPAVLAHQMRIDEGKGLVIVEVRPDSPAKDKLKKFDVILEADGKPVKADVAAFAEVLGKSMGDKPLMLRVLRSGDVIKVEGIKLAEAGKSGVFKIEGDSGRSAAPQGQFRLEPKFERKGQGNGEIEIKQLQEALKALDSDAVRGKVDAATLERIKEALKKAGKDGEYKFEFKLDDGKLKDRVIELKDLKLDLKELKELDTLKDLKFDVGLKEPKDLQKAIELKLDVDLKDRPGQADRIRAVERKAEGQQADLERREAIIITPSVKAGEGGKRVVEAIVEPRTNQIIRKSRDAKGGETIEVEVVTDRPASRLLEVTPSMKALPAKTPVPPQPPRVPALKQLPLLEKNKSVVVDGKPGGEGSNVSLSITRENDQVKIRRQENQETVVIVGSMKGGKLSVESITIDDGRRAKDGKKNIKSYKALNELDGAWLKKVKQLLQQVKEQQDDDDSAADLAD